MPSRKAEVAQLEQLILESMVARWDINSEPEYRGFRCANCQNYINQAYYHWLVRSAFYIPVHFCEACEELYKNGGLDVPLRQTEVDMAGFKTDYPGEKRFRDIVARWKPAKPKLVKFYCDECGEALSIDQEDGRRKGYHVWWKDGNRLHELHFDKKHGDPLLETPGRGAPQH